MNKMIKLRINTPMKGVSAGTVIKIAATKNGKPQDKFWRRRLADSVTDKCVELVSDEPVKTEVKKDVSTSKQAMDSKTDSKPSKANKSTTTDKK